MMRKERLGWLALVLCLCFAVWTAALFLVDVQPIGPEGSRVGFAALNEWGRKITGVNEQPGGVRLFWYQLTEILGYAALGVALCFAGHGAWQLICRRSLAQVDREILLLGLFYGLLLLFYVLFEKVIVNYRPVILSPEEGLEASYPSSHTLLACFIFATAIMELRRTMKPCWLRWAAQGLCAVAMAAAVVGRLLSGVHWFSDIIGGVLLSLALIALYTAAVRRLYRPRHGR